MSSGTGCVSCTYGSESIRGEYSVSSRSFAPAAGASTAANRSDSPIEAISFRIRARGYFNNFDNRLSFNTRPPVCSSGQ